MSWTSMVLRASNQTALNSSISIIRMRNYNSVSISTFSRWSKRSTPKYKQIGAILSSSIIKTFLTLLKRNLVKLFHFLIRHVCRFGLG